MDGHRFHRSTLAGLLTFGVIAVLAAAAPAPAYAAGPRPAFQLPFTCGYRTTLDTYEGHGDYEIDMSAATGTPVLASAGGLAYSGFSVNGGYQVSILHGDGWRTLYLHLKPGTYRFVDGQYVFRGQHIVDSDNTGKKTTGPHLHYEQQNLIDGRWETVQSWFNGVPSRITDDATSPAYSETSLNGADSMSGAGDFDGDGRADFLQLRRDGTLWLYAGNGAGSWARGTQVDAGFGNSCRIAGVGDFDGDGKRDFAQWRTDETLWLYSGNGVGSWARASRIDAGFIDTVRLSGAGDFDGDGRQDLLQLRANGSLWLISGTGTGSWSRTVQIDAGFGNSVDIDGVGDFDGDGKADFLQLRADGSLWLYSGTGTGSWARSSRVDAGFANTAQIAGAGDFDGDGKADFLQLRSDGSLWLYSGTGAGSWARSSRVDAGFGNTL